MAASIWLGASGTPITSEDDCLKIINSLFPVDSRELPSGRADDCAELPIKSPIALSTDYFVESRHFRTSYCTPEEVGAKALARAMSDLAAAGSIPSGFSLGLTIPPSLAQEDLQAIMGGMAEIANEYAITLTGGDICKDTQLSFCVTVWGRSVDEAKGFFLKRGQAAAGDIIFSIGSLGLARAGLWLLENWGRQAALEFSTLCEAHLSPRPQIAAGILLARLALEKRQSISLMDVSDGIATDLPRLLGTSASHYSWAEKAEATGNNQEEKPLQLGAELTLPANGLAPELLAFCDRYPEATRDTGGDASRFALFGGEDYALLGTCPASVWSDVAELTGACHLGVVSKVAAIIGNGEPLAQGGFDHFKELQEDSLQNQGEKGVSSEYAGSGNLSPAICAPRNADYAVDPLLDDLCLESEALLDACKKGWLSGLYAGMNGNASCRVSPRGNLPGGAYLITGTGVPKGSAYKSDLALLALPEGKFLCGAQPSSESALHCGVYTTCKETCAILHVHPPNMLALHLRLSAQGREDAFLALPLIESALYKKAVGYVKEYAFGSEELARAVSITACEYPAIWMKNHGLVTHGKSLAYALALAEELEQIARIQLLAG